MSNMEQMIYFAENFISSAIQNVITYSIFVTSVIIMVMVCGWACKKAFRVAVQKNN